MSQSDRQLQRCPDVTGVILAGGKSSRMGQDKATLTIAGRRLFDLSRASLVPFFDRLLIAGDRPDLAVDDLPCFPDLFPGSALGGLYTGLYHAATPYIFAVACDLPASDPALVRTLLALRQGYAAVVYRTERGLEPLFAVYGKDCLGPMRQLLEQDRFRIQDLFGLVRTRFVPLAGAPAALFNVNTQEDLDRARALAGPQRKQDS